MAIDYVGQIFHHSSNIYIFTNIKQQYLRINNFQCADLSGRRKVPAEKALSTKSLMSLTRLAMLNR